MRHENLTKYEMTGQVSMGLTSLCYMQWKLGIHLLSYILYVKFLDCFMPTERFLKSLFSLKKLHRRILGLFLTWLVGGNPIVNLVIEKPEILMCRLWNQNKYTKIVSCVCQSNAVYVYMSPSILLTLSSE